MRIGIGAQLGIVGGPGTYARELVAALAAAGGHEYVVFTDRPGALADLGLETVHVPMATPYHQVAWDHWRLPRLLADFTVVSREYWLKSGGNQWMPAGEPAALAFVPRERLYAIGCFVLCRA